MEKSKKILREANEMSDKRKRKKDKLIIKMCGLLLMLCLVAGMNGEGAYAEDTDDYKLKNGSFEEGQTWTATYNTQSQGSIPEWYTTATDGKIELFRKNTNTYIPGVTLTPSAGSYAAELNANEESTLYQNVKTTPSSIYKWGLDHGARNGTDTMALVIGPKQAINPSKTSGTGRDQLMQMIDWLIAQGKTSVKTSSETGLGEQLVVYSKKFAANGTFANNEDNNAFSMIPTTVYTEEWHIWIIADNKATSGDNPWGKYGSNAEAETGSGNSEVDINKYYYYTVPTGQTETLFGFVSVGFDKPSISADKAKTYGNFLDNINFQIYHPLSGSTTLHGSGVIAESTGTVGGESVFGTGHEITVDNKLITYVVDGDVLEIRAVVKKNDAEDGCEFVGLYYSKLNANGELDTQFLQRKGNEIEYSDSLTDEQKNGKWTRSVNTSGDIIYTYYLKNLTSATDLQFIFIKCPTVTYDPNGGKAYTVVKEYNINEADNVYSFKPEQVTNDGVLSYTFIPPYVSQAAEGQNDGWKFMGWLLTGDIVANEDIPAGVTIINKEYLSKKLLSGTHTIACDYIAAGDKKEQLFKIWDRSVDTTSNTGTSGAVTSVKWEAEAAPDYANVHRGLTMVAQWRWRQAFVPQLNTYNGFIDSNSGGTVSIISLTDTSDSNYDPAYNTKGGISYHAETNEVITVKATAKDGYIFSGWYDKNENLITSQDTYSYTETKESVNTFYARFTKAEVTQKYIRQINEDGQWKDKTDDSIATLDCYEDTDTVGKTISVTANAKTGYTFLGWYDIDGNKVSEDKLSNAGKTLSYTTRGDATYYARFSKSMVTQTFVRQIKDGDGWRDITDIADNSIATLDSYGDTDTVGKAISVTATVNTGYKFEGWYDANDNKVSDDIMLSYTTIGDATYYARFSVIMVTQEYVRQVKNGESWEDSTDERIAILSRYTYNCAMGKEAGATATAKEGYKFEGWYDAAGNPVSSDVLSNNGMTLSYRTTGDATYYARFSRIMVTQNYIRQLKDGDSWRDITDDSIATLDTYTKTCGKGDSAGATATAKEGYKFEGWYDATGNPVSSDVLSNNGTTLSYTTTGDATYYARFSKIVVSEVYTETFNKIDEIMQLKAIVIPESQEGKSMIWSSSNPEVVAVDADGNLTVVGNGTCTITVTAEDGSYSAVCILTVDIPRNAEPDNTEEPNKPENTEEPDKPDNIEESTEPDSTSESNEIGSSNKLNESNKVNEASDYAPDTGDYTNPALWTILLLMSMILLSGLLAKRKK